MDADLVAVLTDACALCLADVAARGESELHLPLDAATLLVLTSMPTQFHTSTLELVPQGDTLHVRTAWLARYPLLLGWPRHSLARERRPAGHSRDPGQG
jgi:hypothetical protein